MAVDGYWRTIVEYLRLPLTHVVYHDSVNGFRIAAKSIKGANGICSAPGNRIIVDALAGGVSTPLLLAQAD